MLEFKKVRENTSLIYFIVVALFVVMRICGACGVFDFMGEYASFVTSLITQIGLIFLLPLIMFKVLAKQSYKDTFKDFNFRKTSWKVILVSFALGLVVFFINVYVSSFFFNIISIFGYKQASGGSELPATWWVLILNLLTTAVLPAICEETLHRGMLLHGYTSLGVRRAIIISGVLFGLLHMNIEQVFYAMIIGIFFGYLCAGSNSIYPCMIVHFVNNAMSVIISFGRQKGWAIGNIFSYLSSIFTSNVLLGLLLFFLFLCLLLLLAFEFTTFIFKHSIKYNFEKDQKVVKNMILRQNYLNEIENLKTGNVEEPKKEEVVFVNLQDFFKFLTQNQDQIRSETEEYKGKLKDLEIKTKVFMWGAFALSTIITIMTFIWGLLR